ncbi:MAG: putative zinc-binding protein [bacterium]|nr:putative zinc-binding protein [bacterium]
MPEGVIKIGVVSCSGENCLGGTISRLATRKMIDEIYPDKTVTICLPLFLAGGEQERMFANAYPTITVDGCDKLCAKRATEKYSGQVSDALDVSEIIGKEIAESPALSTRNLTDEQREMITKVAQEIKTKFEKVFTDYVNTLIKSGKTPASGCGCQCGG